jgi:hypothetical protein
MPRAKQKREYTIAKVRENVSNFSSLSLLLAPATNKAGKKPLKNFLPALCTFPSESEQHSKTFRTFATEKQSL